MAKQPSKPENAVEYDLNTDSISGKGHATPTRKEREAANLKPLVSGDRKAGNKAARAKMAESRDRARIGMANGEEKYLQLRDRGPQRRYIRDYIDARFNVGEIMIPALFVIIILSFINNPIVQVVSVIALWAFFLVAVADCIVVGFVINRKLVAKFGADRMQKGNRWYAAMRALQLRLMRLPKPQVKRGNFPA
ncbi:MAG: hypothetical protein JWM70_302 [Microbacteriaceae bacterium]|jgi:hypothetical protein|nr:hypothetical protein [Microbacteriaceae bacterium]MDQ1554270.1 hypothetical protein [Microbacteriaceae bacterium]MDQ1606619.1 hypothetical protein [Microbacteriaceae bacterium]